MATGWTPLYFVSPPQSPHPSAIFPTYPRPAAYHPLHTSRGAGPRYGAGPVRYSLPQPIQLPVLNTTFEQQPILLGQTRSTLPQHRLPRPPNMTNRPIQEEDPGVSIRRNRPGLLPTPPHPPAPLAQDVHTGRGLPFTQDPLSNRFRVPGSWSPRPGDRGGWSPSPPDLYDYVDFDDHIHIHGFSPTSSDSDGDYLDVFIVPTSHSRNSARLRGGYECQFVETISSDLQTDCSVCLGVLCEPYLVDCCGHRFCYSCIKTVQDDGRSCPLCNEKSFRTCPDKQLQRILNQKQVYCKHKDDGCTWTGELSKFDEHLNSTDGETNQSHLEGCPFVKLECHHCKKLIKREELKIHEVRCSDGAYTCEYCSEFTSTYSTVTDDHWPVCEAHPVPCPNKCGANPKRSEVDRHVACECELTVIQCDFANSGCEVKLPRIEMADHMEVGALDHVHLLASKNTTLTKANHEAATEIDHMKLECADLAFEVHCLEEDNTNLFSHNCLLEEELGEKEREIAALRKRVVQAERQVQHWNDQTKNHPSVFIQNLPGDANEQKLKSLFGAFGRIVSVEVKTPSHAVVVFEQPEAVARALAKSKDSQGLKLHRHKLKLSVM